MPLIPICLIYIFKYIRQYRFNKRGICLSMYVFVSEDHMLDWHLCQICYPLEMKLSERERERERERESQRGHPLSKLIWTSVMLTARSQLNLKNNKQTRERKKERKRERERKKKEMRYYFRLKISAQTLQMFNQLY